MDLGFLTFGGYGAFVWPAFIFTFGSCLYHYIKVRRELFKQERIFANKYKQLYTTEILIKKPQKNIKKVFLNSSVF